MVYNILEFGAKTETDCTESIQSAIDKCAENCGGCVFIPSGTYISGTIWLKDNVELHFETGAVLKASTNLDDYNAEDAYPQNWGSKEEKWRAKHLIIALECKNVAITGNGIIDGSGDAFFGTERTFYSGYAWEGGYVTSKDEDMLRPGQLVCFIECDNVKVRDITLKNMPCWGLFFHGCENVQVSGITVTNPFDYVNTDGIDIDCCRYVTVSDCIINTGDDAIAIRCDSQHLKRAKACENVVITNCTLASNSSVFRIGVGVGEIRHVRISNIIVSRGGNLVTFATSYFGHGNAEIEDIGLSDISAYNIGRMLDCVAEKSFIKNISMRNMLVYAGGETLILQKNEGVVSDILLKDITLILTRKIKKDKKYIIQVENADNIVLDSVNVSYATDTWEKVFHKAGVGNVIVKACSFEQ